MTVQTVRARLDTIYLETLVAAENSGAMKPATGQEVTELQEEVESLYSEISSVAQISIEKQYLEPALQSIATKNGRSLSKTVSSLNYVRNNPSHAAQCFPEERIYPLLTSLGLTRLPHASPTCKSGYPDSMHMSNHTNPTNSPLKP